MSVRWTSEQELKERLKKHRSSKRLPTYNEINEKMKRKQNQKLARVRMRIANEPFRRSVGHKIVLTDFMSEKNGDSKNSE